MRTIIQLLLVASLAVGTVRKSHAAEDPVVQKIRASNVFRTPLELSGTAVAFADESKALETALDQFAGSLKSGLAASELFLKRYPGSPWSPSLQINLAEYYRQNGRYSLALDHWEKAWGATKQSHDIVSEQLAVRAFAGWTRLLASIGEKDKVKDLYNELMPLQLPLGSYSTVIEETQEGVVAMNSKPQVAFRCGSYALGNLALALNLSSSTSSNLFATDSPTNGFRMDQLIWLAESNNMAMEAVERPAGATIIVPSVVHWKLNHYAAIVDSQNGKYKVIDPTFRGHVWMDAETIDSETDGAFLVLKTNAPLNWSKLSLAQCSTIYGKGYPNEFGDPDDDGPDQCPLPDPDPDEDSDLPAANDGPGDGSPSKPPCDDGSTTPDASDTDSGGDDTGMPRWAVSEPYMTLWLTDTPLLYRKSSGKWVKLQIRYKNRGEDKGSNIGSFGPNWECNFIGFLQENSATPDTFVDHSAGGGTKSYNTNGTPNYKSVRTFVKGNAFGGGGGGGSSAPQISGSGGSTTSFEVSASGGVGVVNHFPTHRVNRYGQISLLKYETISSLVRITNSVDTDGKSLTFSYGNGTFPNLVTSVTDPYGRSAYFTYNASGLLTNITDMAGMATAFQYDSSYRITNMVTSYGTNSFQYFSGVSATYGNSLRRSLLVTEASGDKQLYSYCDNGPDAAAADGLVGYRNSYHWNRAQYAAISSTGKGAVLDMPDADYKIAPSKHWFHGNNNADGFTVSDTLATSAKPADASGNRASVYYGYSGAAIGSAFIGTQKRMTQYQTSLGNGFAVNMNNSGRPTNMTFYKAGQAANYTNNYDTSGKLLKTLYGPRGERIRAYGYNSAVTNLLTSYTNALNEVTQYTYDTNAMKLTSVVSPSGLVQSNIYYSSGPSSGFLAIQMDLGIRTNSYSYTNGNLLAETNALGLVKTHIYDGLNRQISTAFPDGTTVSNIYDKLDLVAKKDQLNQWTYYGYNKVQQLIAVTNVAGEIITFDYCSCGSPSQVTRWNGTTPVITYYHYDISGNLTNVTFPDGYQLNYTINADDNVDTITDSGGYYLHMDYTLLGTQPTVYQATLNGQTLFTHYFDEYGRVIQSIDRDFVLVTNNYDFKNRLIATRSIGWGGGGADMTGLETFAYDVNGLAHYTNALGMATHYLRDAAGRMLCETNANNEVISFTYNPADELLSLTDGKAQTTQWNYDPYGRVTNKVDAAANVLFVYQYDVLNRLTNRWSAAKSNTVYRFDPIGNLTNVVYVSGNTPNIVLRYDGLNRVTNIIDAVGSTGFIWTDGDQMAGEDGPWASDTVLFSYTNRLRSALILSQPNASDWKQSYGYDSMKRLSQLISPIGEFDYSYSYWSSDKYSTLTFPNGSSINNTFDSLMRLTQTYISTWDMYDMHQYGYNSGNQRTQQVNTVDGSGRFNYVNFSYDNIGQLKTAKGVSHDYSPATGTYSEVTRAQEQFGYGYDAAWNLQYRTNNSLVQSFNVDNRNQLTTATRSGSMTVAGTATEPRGDGVYGPAGTTNVTVSGTGLSSGAANLYFDGTWARSGATLADGNNTYTATAKDTYGRISTDSVTVNLPSTNTFIYDLNGNLRTNNSRVFDYDDENQLIRITEPNTWKEEFAYDGLMRRKVRKEFAWTGAWAQTNEVRYVFDGMLVVQERDANNLPTVTYTRGNDLSATLQGAGGVAGMLARTDNRLMIEGNPTASAYYFADGIGNITSLIYTNGALAAKYSYDPFGNVINRGGPLGEVNKYRFSTKELDYNSGLYYYGYRLFDPTLQRWLTKDPLGDLASLSLSVPKINFDTASKDGQALTDDEISDGLAEINRNIFKSLGNNPIGYFDALGLCDDSLDATARSNPGEIGKFAKDAAQEGREYCKEKLAEQEAKALADKAAQKLAEKAALELERKAMQKAAEKTAKAFARQIGKDLGEAARREFHDLDHLTDRTIDELRQDAMEVYHNNGGTCPAWMRP